MIIAEPEEYVLNPMTFVTIAGRQVTGRMSAESHPSLSKVLFIINHIEDNTLKIKGDDTPVEREDT